MFAFEDLKVVVEEGLKCLEVLLTGKLSFAVVCRIHEVVQQLFDPFA